jgi:hypothetical protein
LRTTQSLEDAIFLLDIRADFLCESFRRDQVADPEASPSRFVFIGRANASQRCSNFSFTELLFTGRFQCPMIRKYDLTAVGYEEPVREMNPEGGNGIGFFKECDGIQDDAATNDARHAVVKYAARHQVQYMPSLAKRDRMAGIVAALVAGDAVEFPGEDVDDFAFAFISPLETYDC